MDELACEAVIFDLDGVLVDSTALVEDVWRTWAAGRGIDPAAVLAIAHGRRSLDTIRQIAPHLEAAAELAALASIERITAPEVLVSADDVTFGKPDPEGYRTAAARLGVPPGACVVVEDAPAGVAAARASGARVIAVTTTHRPEALAAADLIAGSLNEIEIRAAEGCLLVRRRRGPAAQG